MSRGARHSWDLEHIARATPVFLSYRTELLAMLSVLVGTGMRCVSLAGIRYEDLRIEDVDGSGNVVLAVRALQP